MLTAKPHQKKAIDACVRGLRKSPRGQCIMACGSGKTFVGYKVAEGLKAKKVLVLVPSMMLIAQVVREYRRYGAQNLLAICSSEKKENDEIRLTKHEIDAELTDDGRPAAEFLRPPGMRVVVCTYQSASVLGVNGFSFDLVIYDEAHRTAGDRDKAFALTVHDDQLVAKKRLFLTATPKHVYLSKKEGEVEDVVFSMTDPDVYGPVFYELPLREAIELGLVCDYRVVVVHVAVPKGTIVEPNGQVVRVALNDAMTRFGVRKVFSFHGTVAEAMCFSAGEYNSMPGVRMLHINGDMSGRARQQTLEIFSREGKAVLSNCSCLGEGIDLPEADGIAFLSPKEAKIGIVQAVGRALRVADGKKEATIFLPVFVPEQTDDGETALFGTEWYSCWGVLQALRETDHLIAEELFQMAVKKDPDGEGFGKRRRVWFTGDDDPRLTAKYREMLRAQLVRPFRNDGERARQHLLQLADNGAPRPNHKSKNPEERKWGVLLLSLTNARGRQRHPEFNDLIRSTVWFNSTAERKQKALLLWAKSGRPRPSQHSSDPAERQAGYQLSRYTGQDGRRLYPEFNRQLALAAPDWASYLAERRWLSRNPRFSKKCTDERLSRTTSAQV